MVVTIITILLFLISKIMQLNTCLNRIFKYSITFTILLFVVLNVATAQDENKEKEVVEITAKAIPLSDISAESEDLAKRITKLRTILNPSSKIEEIDSLINDTSHEITLRKDSLFQNIDNLSQRRLKIELIEWGNYKSELKDYQNILSTRLTKVTKTNKELTSEYKRWEITKEKFTDKVESKKIFNSIDTVLITLEGIIKISLVRLDSIFLVQKSLTNLIVSVDEVISEIKRMELQLQKNYFIMDSPALWKLHEIDSIANDTLNVKITNSYSSVKGRVGENLQSLSEYIKKNLKTFIFQISFLFLMLLLIFVVKRHWEQEPHELTNQIEKEAYIVLQFPFAATIAVGFLASAFFYKSLIPIFSEIHVLLILSATTYLLPRFTTKHFTRFLLLLWLVYVIQSVDVYLNPFSLLFRILLILDSIILIVALIYGRIEIKKNPNKFTHISTLFKLVTPIYFLFLLFAIISDIIGMVHLSHFIVSGVLSSTTLGIIVYLAVKVTTSFFILLFKLRDSMHTQALSTMVKVTQKRIKPILLFIAFILWILFTLKSFEIYNHLLNYAEDILMIKWDVGKLTISLGGILSFSMIFVIAILLAKLAAAIFHDDWMIQVLPRGLAPAISLILRIFIISIGLYAALSAAGLDLSKLGFIVGALGVGIGFGLQNVVLNFIAGLILAFERPINLGDTIEIDQEKGVVTNIGVRSSNIRTYSGSEAIIPNGDLISKKVVNWTLANRDRRSKILMKTSANADPEKVVELFNSIAAEHPGVFKNPKPYTLFRGFNVEGNLDFELYYWTTFNQTLDIDHDIALSIFKKLKEENIQAPIPVRKIISSK